MVTFHNMVTGNILNEYFKNSTGESMFTYYFSAVRMMDTNNLRCLMKCQKITSCTGIDVNTVTGEFVSIYSQSLTKLVTTKWQLEVKTGSIITNTLVSNDSDKIKGNV